MPVVVIGVDRMMALVEMLLLLLYATMPILLLSYQQQHR
jgi:hypothetical protein